MIRASRAITLVLIGTAAAAVPAVLTTALRPSYDDADGGGDFDTVNGPTTRNSYYGSSSPHSHYSHSYWFWHSGTSSHSFWSSPGSRSSSGAHSGTSRGGFGSTGHAHSSHS